MTMVAFTKEVAQLIESQFPAIYREEGEELTAFVKAYYEFLQSNDMYSYKIGRQIFDIGDVDSSLNEFLKHFKSTYLTDFPFKTITDKRFAIKHINDYYSTKGTEQSLQLLMKLLFNEEVDVYYPGEDILRASDSDWYKPYYLEVTVSSRNASFLNKEITGVKSGAKAFVESIVRKRVNGKVFDVLYLSDLRGSFKTNERVTDDGIIAKSPKIIGSMTAVDVVLGGRNNAVGDIFNVVTDEGVQGKVKVTSISSVTGRVDFSIYKPGWGYTADNTTDVYVSDALLFVDNANSDLIQYETVYQPIEKISVISATNVLGNDPIGKYIIGKTSNGSLTANGIIVGVANTNANGEVVTTATSNGIISIQVSDGTFSNQKSITLSSNTNYSVGEYVNEESTYEISITNKVGNFTTGEKVEQTINTTYGMVVTGITSTLSTSNTTINVSSTANLIVGQPLVKTGGTGAFQAGTTIKKINSGTQLVLDRLPLTAGAITFTANTYSLRTGYAYGKVSSASNSTVVVLEDAFGTIDLSSNTVIVGVTSAASALPTSVYVSSIGARGQVSSVSGNTITVDVNYGVFSSGNLIRGDKTKRVLTINSVVDAGAYYMYLQANNSANAIVYSANVAPIEGIVIGQNTTAIGVYGNTEPFFFAQDIYTSYIYTRREDLLSPPRYANNSIIELQKSISRIAGGKSANFEIGAITDVEENVTFYTDIIGGTNAVGVPYSQITLNGQNSGFGFVSSMTITSGGTGYANNDRVSFSGGGYAGGEPTVSANAYVTTDGSGVITSITVDTNGEGYYQAPTFILPNNGAGVDANVAVVMNFGYGFPKNPNAEYFNFIGDVLNSTIADIGSIEILSRINPGTEYTADPFVAVRNKYTASYQRYDLILNVVDVQNGTFRVGEEIVQTVLTSTSVKGRVKAVDINSSGTGKIYLERTSLSIAFSDGYVIRGAETGTTATLVSFFADQTVPPIGENGVVNANAIFAVGVATGLEVVSSGFGYIDNGSVILESVSGTNPFIITAKSKTQKQGISEGFWRSTNSHLNSEKKLHDNKYYQEFSYDVMSGLSLNRYETVLKKVFHVAGTRLFGSVVKVSSIDSTAKIANSSITKETT